MRHKLSLYGPPDRHGNINRYVIGEAKTSYVDDAVKQLEETADFLVNHVNYRGEAILPVLFMHEGADLSKSGYDLIDVPGGKVLGRWDDGRLERVWVKPKTRTKGNVPRVYEVFVKFVKPELLDKK